VRVGSVRVGFERVGFERVGFERVGFVRVGFVRRRSFRVSGGRSTGPNGRHSALPELSAAAQSERAADTSAGVAA